MTPKADDTRRRVTDAAMLTILEKGYYRASSNEIARRAGVTWGVIQYHFGTRENLLLATLEQSTADYVDYLEGAEVTGETLEDRLISLGRIITGHYAEDIFVARLQIVWNLTHDPQSAPRTADSLRHSLKGGGAALRELIEGACEPIPISYVDRQVIFSGLRGVALHGPFFRAFYPMEPEDRELTDQLTTAMARALALDLRERYGHHD